MSCTPLIGEDNNYFPRGCTMRPQHQGMAEARCNHDGTWTMVCNHCHEVVYESLVKLVEHDFVCQGDKMCITSRALKVTVHRCGDVSGDDLVDVEELLPKKEAAASST